MPINVFSREETKFNKYFAKFLKNIYTMLNRKNKSSLGKILISLFIAAIVIMQNPVFYAIAQTTDVPTAPTAPTPPPQPESTVTPPPEPTAPPAPTAPVAPGSVEEALPTPRPTVIPVAEEDEVPSGGVTGQSSSGSGGGYTNGTPVAGTGAQVQEGQTGSTTINTGDANNTGNISTLANTNLSAGPVVSGGSGGLQLANSGNGSGSDNSDSVSVNNDNNTIQNNEAIVGNNLFQETISGENSVSKNTGGDNTIISGDANTTGTILNTLNTNIDGVVAYEFNITDDHLGDYILDLANATCVQGCTPTSTTVKNTGNGADSTNDGTVDLSNTDNLLQTNDALLQNNLNLLSDSGDNKTSMNTGGDNSITSGDANVSGSVVNMVNNNIEGSVVYAVVNIFGDLIGDIILPDGTIMSCCATGSASAVNSSNGVDSTNNANIDQNNENNTYQFNNVDIQNNLVMDAGTGDNDANMNTDGSSSVTTGDTNVVAQVLNVANTNIVGGNWWLVLVNEAGQWVGKIVGSPDGQDYAGSSGFEFVVNELGEITVVNSGNGAGSNNSGNVTQNNDTTVIQDNNATLINNVNLAANTGNNRANMNTGGSNTIQTGDANIVANIVNFVNNNITGGGKLFVTVVNVFGKWLGDFYGPGQTKEVNNDPNPAIGGVAENHDQSDNNTTANSNSNDSGGGSANMITRVAMGLFNSSSSDSGNSNATGEGENSVTVLGAVDENNGGGSNPTAGKKVVHVNLAYMTPFALFAVYYIIRKRRMALKTSVRANHAYTN